MYTNKKATVVGWGITSYPMGTPSTILQKIQVEVVSNFHCSRIIEETIGPGMICAAPPALQGTCFVSVYHAKVLQNTLGIVNVEDFRSVTNTSPQRYSKVENFGTPHSPRRRWVKYIMNFRDEQSCRLCFWLFRSFLVLFRIMCVHYNWRAWVENWNTRSRSSSLGIRILKFRLHSVYFLDTWLTSFFRYVRVLEKKVCKVWR